MVLSTSTFCSLSSRFPLSSTLEGSILFSINFRSFSSVIIIIIIFFYCSIKIKNTVLLALLDLIGIFIYVYDDNNVNFTNFDY